MVESKNDGQIPDVQQNFIFINGKSYPYILLQS